MNKDFYRDAQRLALQAGLLGVRVGEWATKEGHSLLLSAHKWLEETARAVEEAEKRKGKTGAAAASPAVPVEESVTDEHIVCLEDGRRFKTLKRHLRNAHGLSPTAYRERWGLAADYPMLAPGYALKQTAVMEIARKARKRKASGSKRRAKAAA